MCLPICRGLIDFARRLGARDDGRARGRARWESRARGEAKRRRCEALTEPLARQTRGAPYRVLRVPLVALTLVITLSLSLSLDLSVLHPPFHLLFYRSIPPPIYSPSCAHIFSFLRTSLLLLLLPPPTRTTLSTLLHPHRVIIVYTRNTGKHREATMRSYDPAP